jgi:2-oxoglutarate ferredoxin oxidoreductase subunit alpha
VTNKVLMCGNDAMSEAAVRAGCRFYFGYPITPQNEVAAYMARRMPEVRGTFIQAESEIAAVNMVFGAATVGARAMTSSSSPGISLKQEGISYLSGCELPAVIANVVRGGPGLGSIGPSQSDYFQATRGGGHGDYRTIALAPSTVQELVDLTYISFELADKYRNPVLILSDGLLGQMMEPVVLPDFADGDSSPKEWALTGAKNRPPNLIRSLYLDVDLLEKLNFKLQEKFRQMERQETRLEEVSTTDAQVMLVAYGSVARICRSAVRRLREAGVKAGLFRPITVWPFPYEQLSRAAEKAKVLLAVEMSMGQMVDDVKLAVGKNKPVRFFGRVGGCVMSVDEVVREVRKLHEEAG